MIFKVLLKYIFGYVRIVVEGYYIERFINICTNSKILMWNLKREKGVKLYLNLGIQDYYKAIQIAKKLKCKAKIVKKRGIPFLLNKYRKRKIFIISLLTIIVALYISSNYIWNIEIETEENMKIDNILEDVNLAGLKIGMRKNTINIEEITNKIRLKRNDISWIGIKLKGTNAIVKVVKAKEAPELIDEKEYSNILAKKSGTITKIIAQNGTALVKVGDEVQEGQILIQGTMEGKYTGIRYVHSLGDVEAIVKYTKTDKIYYKELENVKTGKKEEKYKIKIFSNLYLPISLDKLTNYELEENSREYTVAEATEIGTKKLEEQIETEIENKQSILRKNSERI